MQRIGVDVALLIQFQGRMFLSLVLAMIFSG